MENFPTGKGHVSYSEVKAWSECSFRHKLMYVDKIETYEDNPYADFGTIIHEEIESFLNGKAIDLDKVYGLITKKWDEKGYDSEEYIEKVTNHRSSNGWKYTHENLDCWKKSANNILLDLPLFLNETYPGWEIIKAEQELYENIENHTIKFKGFIDCVLKVPKKNNPDKFDIWIIDWKTTGPSGWYYTKKKDFLSLAQLGLYKAYWSRKFNVELKNIKIGYVFLKRGAKLGKTCELFKVSAGPKFIEKTDKLVDHMIKNVKKGFSLKNYNNCKFCPFKGTEHCSGPGW